MDFYYRSRNVARTCRHFGISRQTFYRWRRRYDPQDLTTLESRSHRPHRRRQPTWPAALAEQVLALPRQFPRWGKDRSPIQNGLILGGHVSRIATLIRAACFLVSLSAPQHHILHLHRI
jgi:hypothetical protein